MTSDEIFKRFKTLLLKEVNGYYNPEEFEGFINQAQVEMLNDLIGPNTEHQPGRPIPLKSSQSPSRTKQSLRMFRTEVNVPIVSGYGTFPDDFAYYEAGSFRYYTADCTETSDKPGVHKFVPIMEVNDQAWADTTSSEIDYPTPIFPILRFRGKSEIEISPRTIQLVQFVYLRYPLNYYWGRQVVNGLYEHDPTDPLDQSLEWDDMEVYPIIDKAVQLAAVSQENDRLYQMSKDIDK